MNTQKNENVLAFVKTTLDSDQDTHRLTELAPLDDLAPVAVASIKALCAAKDRAKQAAGVLLYAVFSKRQPVVVISCDNLDELIKNAQGNVLASPFTVLSKRGASTIWSQLTGLLVDAGVVRIIKAQKGRAPGVIEIIHDEFFVLGLLPKATDELRLTVINSTSKRKYVSLESYYATRPQDSYAASPTRDETAIPQDYKSSRQTEEQSANQNEEQGAEQDENAGSNLNF